MNKKIYGLVFSFMIYAASSAQTGDSLLLSRIDSIAPERALNTHGDLLHDDTAYNKKAPLWLTGLRGLSVNVFNWALNRYYFDVEWTSSGWKDWKYNFRKGPEWDKDGFGTNFIGHPHTGSYYYNVARSNGYSYWQSVPFTAASSLVWEYLGENERPSYNDLIMTTAAGTNLGEVFYRVTSNILDDRSRGAGRIWREAVTFFINPTRSINRATSGKMFRVTDREVYQKAPMSLVLSTGAHRANISGEGGNMFGTGKTYAIANLRMDYGDLFEPVKKKPFDFFRFRLEMRTGVGQKKISIVESYGLLTGKAIRKDRLYGGLFQHFDYWRNNQFEVGAAGYGAGLVANTEIGEVSKLHSVYHVAAVPLAGYPVVPNFDTNPFRGHNLSGGLQAKVEQHFDFLGRANIGFTSYFYWLHVYAGVPASSFVRILKPFVGVNITRNIRLGFEQQFFYDNRKLRTGSSYRNATTEQRLYLQFLFRDDLWRMR